MTTRRTSDVLGHFEPRLGMTVLRACPGCGAAHPRARGLDTDRCPDCGTGCPTGESRSVLAALSGWSPWALLARLLLWLGRCLAKLAGSI